MADSTFLTVSPALKAVDQGDGTYAMAIAIVSGVGFGESTDYTIAAGVIIFTGVEGQRRLKLIPEGGPGAGADTINTIISVDVRDGDIVILQAKDAAGGDVITIDKSAGNFLFSFDFTCNTDSDIIALMYDSDLSKWIRIWYMSNP